MTLATIAADLAADLERLSFSPPVAHVYNPLVYARAPHEEYLRRYGAGPKEALFVGMNPGPWGMAQTGVPFGEIAAVTGWLGINGPVAHPAGEHPKKRVDGFACRRSEVSGRRLWGLIRERFGEPERFFARFFVVNYCPLLFLNDAGGNITPDKLKNGERQPLLAACDRALRQTVALLRPRLVIGVGGFAETQAREALAGSGVAVGRILHPSPANPAANRDWAGTVLAQLAALGIDFGEKGALP
ncbi:single-strand selective monofunctional uracil DNA glycosylase [Geotalea uraniireducens]|uniref:Single-strand selective monofunctional uracil DNA glycosylase n=1 Tax=Geotalea uraniireducens TaxID=351604 RepID=A0ABM8ER03_9BACT|nr:uracil-DNA glycosylase family protein [Geotalea uraniireducens]BDV44717.1 single-strand selective monofunctional uracil DNA glycosylase [Geotalea uraniireducens]